MFGINFFDGVQCSVVSLSVRMIVQLNAAAQVQHVMLHDRNILNYQHSHDFPVNSHVTKNTWLCHVKTVLQIYVIFIPREVLAGTSPAKPFIDMTLTIKTEYNCIVSVIGQDTLAELVPAKSSLGMETTKI